MANTLRAGRIAGNPLTGLCERICIEVQRVYDGCRENFNNQTVVLTLGNVSAEAVPPFTYVGAENYGTATIENVSVVSLDNGRSRITGDVVIPVLVTFLDAHNNAYTGTSTLRLHRSFVLRIPERSVAPYSLHVLAAFVSESGSFLSDDTVSATGCYTFVVKVVVPTDILVPTYGHCVYPACEDCDGNICEALLSLPLFP